jgi:hypothetical protein
MSFIKKGTSIDDTEEEAARIAAEKAKLKQLNSMLKTGDMDMDQIMEEIKELTSPPLRAIQLRATRKVKKKKRKQSRKDRKRSRKKK